MDPRKIYILVVAILLGIFVVAQNKSFNKLDVLSRDGKSNVFQEIQILKEKNLSLKSEMDDLEANLKLLTSQGDALKAIDDEIKRYTKISGQSPIFGPGFYIKFEGKITTPWLVDFINELWSTGAQAVAVNGIRITNETVGFDSLPQGQVLLNGSILSSPFVIEVIGESSTILGNIEVGGGILQRMKAALPGMKVSYERKDIIQMQ
ncbi:hypothetical protein COU74_05260 [Candidatus Peregrinibacteria bacterium CG10_big_fil_rev_8_21_14_0_10_36_19]|nr:MAG: hypothetical protein COU74_05260 [Candidatus Peregrinibacteria bacterium CG10_big_fil_rev_8_21_14_0_10_36_19]